MRPLFQVYSFQGLAKCRSESRLPSPAVVKTESSASHWQEWPISLGEAGKTSDPAIELWDQILVVKVPGPLSLWKGAETPGPFEGNDRVFHPSIFRCELLVSGRVTSLLLEEACLFNLWNVTVILNKTSNLERKHQRINFNIPERSWVKVLVNVTSTQVDVTSTQVGWGHHESSRYTFPPFLGPRTSRRPAGWRWCCEQSGKSLISKNICGKNHPFQTSDENQCSQFSTPKICQWEPASLWVANVLIQAPKSIDLSKFRKLVSVYNYIILWTSKYFYTFSSLVTSPLQISCICSGSEMTLPFTRRLVTMRWTFSSGFPRVAIRKTRHFHMEPTWES